MHKAECRYAKPVELNRTYEEIEYMERLCEDLDRHDAKEREEHDRLTITAAIDLVNDHAVAHTEDLLKVARIGQMLFDQAVYTADEQDNTEFFVKAFEEWPDEVTELMEKMQLSFGVEERDQSTGERTGDRNGTSTTKTHASDEQIAATHALLRSTPSTTHGNR